MSHSNRLDALRAQMKQNNIDAYIIPSADPHISEYLPARYKCLEWLSGFTGSAGTLAVTADFAGLWTDSRYFVQAQEQLKGTSFELVKLQNQGAPEYIGWVSQRLQKGQRLAFDGNLAPIAIAEELLRACQDKAIEVIADLDLLSPIWKDRPALPAQPAYLLSEEQAGQSTASKIQRVRKALTTLGARYHLISSLDDIAWLFNLRGGDVKCNPVVLSFALISPDRTELFIDENKLQAEDAAELKRAGVELRAYDTLSSALTALPEGESILIDPKRNCYANYKAVAAGVKRISDTNPTTHLKARKNETELERTRQTMVKDGVALTRFFIWLEKALGKEKITEQTVAEKLYHFRSQQIDFVGESFDTIAGYKAHGALPHYKATPESDAELSPEGLLLIDSGGQYKTGTTDITRVVSLGRPTDQEKKDYTLVLRAMIEGCSCHFPEGTRGYQVDAITRKPLWDHFRNYGHGTGHGVGFFLNVHEGPQVINTAPVDLPLAPDMINSIEPGLYREGAYGIRIENLVACQPGPDTEFGRFLQFETLTLCYIEQQLIDPSLLEEKHIGWLNSYHQTVYKRLSTELNTEEREWLKHKTSVI